MSDLIGINYMLSKWELYVDGIKCQTYNKLDALLNSLLFINIVFEDNIKIFMRGAKL